MAFHCLLDETQTPRSGFYQRCNESPLCANSAVGNRKYEYHTR